MFCNNVSVLCLHVIVTDYVLSGEIAGNKHPILLLLLLFKYLGATLTDRECQWRLGYGDGAYNTIRMEKAGREGTGCSVLSNNKFEGVRQAMMYDAGTCAVKKAREEVGCGGNDVKMYE